jgi:DNA-binding transcriptional LysR family regulator
VLVPRAIAWLRERSARTRIRVEEAGSEVLLDGLRAGRLDCVVAGVLDTDDTSGFVMQPLYQLPVVSDSDTLAMLPEDTAHHYESLDLVKAPRLPFEARLPAVSLLRRRGEPMDGSLETFVRAAQEVLCRIEPGCPDEPQNAAIPVIARPRISAWMSCVPS